MTTKLAAPTVLKRSLIKIEEVAERRACTADERD